LLSILKNNAMTQTPDSLEGKIGFKEDSLAVEDPYQIIARLEKENALLRGIEEQHILQARKMNSLLDAFAPQPLNYSCSVPGVQMAGWSLAQNSDRGADFSYPIVFEAPQDRGRCSVVSMPADKSHTLTHQIGKGRSSLGLLLADCMGHHPINGMPAIAVSLVSRMGLNYELRENDSATPTFGRMLNDTFYLGSASAHPISLFLAQFTPDSEYLGRVNVAYLSFGHPHPVILRHNSEKVDSINVNSNELHKCPALGILPSSEVDPDDFIPNRFTLYPGDLMMPYSDGLSDLGADDRGALGGSRPYFYRSGATSPPSAAERLLYRMRSRSAFEIAQGLMEDVLTYREPREDDISCWIVKAKPLSES
jgi:hypothetical protein